MADQGLWWKLWCAALDDPDLDNLDVADFGRYCKAGAFVKRHGVGGEIVLAPPSRGLCTMLQVADFDALMAAFHRMPNVDVRRADTKCSMSVSTETNATVTFKNWQRYQGDYSTFRVRNKRARETEMKRIKRRGDEKRSRREEMRREVLPPVVPHGGPAVEILTWLNTKAEKNFRPSEVNLALIRARLKDGVESYQLKAIISRKVREWQGTEQAKYLRPATLFNKTKCEQYLGDLPPASPDGDTN